MHFRNSTALPDSELDKHTCLLDSEGGSPPLLTLPYQKHYSRKVARSPTAKGEVREQRPCDPEVE